jgi:hypothetical protein
VSGLYTEAVVVMDVERRKMVVNFDVYIQALYIYGYMEKTEMFNVTLSQVNKRENIFIQ